MAILATGQPPPGVVQPPSNPSNLSPPLNPLQTSPQTYKSILKPSSTPNELTASEPIFELHHGEPSFLWEDQDIENMVINEELEFAVVGKFAYGMPEFNELKKQLPLQLDLKGECRIGFLESRHVLFRLSLLEDYVHLLSRPAFYINIGYRLHQMRGLKYEVWFDAKEETSIGVAWISFPGLPPVFFGQKTVFSLARAVGRPLQLDAATKSKSRPSCAKVKVEVDLLAPRPQRLRIGIKNSLNGETRFKWIKIKYDYIPKYCGECRLQGHNEVDCYVLHPDLVPSEDANEVAPKVVSARQEPLKVLKSGKIVGPLNKAGEDKILVEKDAPIPTQNQGRQEKNFKKYVHPNRNPNAWTRVTKKSKQITTDAARVNQSETVATMNAFELLEIDEEARDVEKTRCEVQKNAQNVEDKGETQEVQVKTSHILETSATKSKDLEDLMMGVKGLSPNPLQLGTRSWAHEVFRDHPKVDAVGVSVQSGTGKKRANLNDVVSMSIEAGGLAVRNDVEQPSALTRAAGSNVEAEETRVNEAEGIDAATIDNKAVRLVRFNATGGDVKKNSAFIKQLHAHALSTDALLLEGVRDSPSLINIVDSRGNLRIEQPSFKTPSVMGNNERGTNLMGDIAAFNAEQSRGSDVEQRTVLKLGDTNGESTLNDSILLDKQCSPINNVDRALDQDIQYGINQDAHVGTHNDVQHALDKVNEGLKLGNKFRESTNLHANMAATLDAVDLRAERGRDFTSAFNDEAALDVNLIDVESRGGILGDVEQCGSTLITPSKDLITAATIHDFQSPIVDVGVHLNELFCEDLELAAASTSPLGKNDTGRAISEDVGVVLTQGPCVENKQALSIPSLEVSTSLESASVAKPKFFGRDLIPTVQLERLCRSASPNFGKSFLNINAPSFVPKSLMQLVTHSKYLPTDDELVERMDLNDTRGILARQVGSFQDRFHQGHYLVEDDDLFEEEELDEESTAHNFSMVAREGDLSPREICDNAPKIVMRVRRPLEPTRVQPSRSAKSKSKRSNKSKNSKK